MFKEEEIRMQGWRFAAGGWRGWLLLAGLLVGVWTAAAVGASDGFVVRSDSFGGSGVFREGGVKASSPTRDAGRWVIAVGIRKFADTRIQQLKYCVADARSIAAYFAADGVPREHILLLEDESATRAGVLAALDRVSRRIASAETLFFFYSSHGAGDRQGNTYFIAFDTVGDDLANTALPMQELKKKISAIPCRNIVMLIDTCHSGGAKGLKRPGEKAFDKLLRVANRNTRVAILTSSRTHETSMESDEWRHGAFTYYLLQGLAGAGDDFPRDGRVSVTELFDYVMVAVPRATRRSQHPSGKFSYNWPGDKEKAVRVGRVLRQVAPGGGNPRPPAGSGGGAAVGGSSSGGGTVSPGSGGWQSVIE